MDPLPQFAGDDQQITYLFAWGRNKDGELSIGNQKKCNTPKAVQGLKNQTVQLISSGSNHSGIVTLDGQLFICGSALHGKLGFEDANQPSYPKFLLVQAMKGLFVTQVATGDYHTLCLLDNGQVYAWGGTLHKKLGSKAGKPARIETLKQTIVQIGCGDFHSAALSANGDLYTWGGGGRDYNRGQLGHGHLNDVETPQVVKDNIVKFSCGGYHMMALDKDGELWSWGSGMYGETGQGEFQDSLLPKKVKVNFNQKHIIIDDIYVQNKQESTIKEISLGGHHSLLLSNKGIVYACGYAQHGQLGIKATENQNKFQLVIGLSGKTIVQIAAGWNHSIVLTSHSDVYTCGHNQAGQLGVGDYESRTQYTRINFLEKRRIKQLFAGGNHSWALIDYNQPRIDDYSPPSPLNEEVKIENFTQPLDQGLQDLEIVITEVKMHHRFVKIQVPTQFQTTIQAKINDYLNFMQKDPNTKLSKFQNDALALGIQEDNNKLSFTIMMIMDLSQYKMPFEELDEGKVNQIGKQFVVKRSTFNKNPIYDWIIQAEKIMNIPGIQIKFLELRPLQ
ncbi:unnamed protein product [Paramecium pentaurelia]|uniref:RCC1-like domain-containing protein n=1 Tax=Paramecium pentaurelia TaxID=43138 RepID=A0A8S1X0J9_9CILI|nr:unnamed protein product [Paramecium pentaurelia]